MINTTIRAKPITAASDYARAASDAAVAEQTRLQEEIWRCVRPASEYRPTRS